MTPGARELHGFEALGHHICCLRRPPQCQMVEDSAHRTHAPQVPAPRTWHTGAEHPQVVTFCRRCNCGATPSRDFPIPADSVFHELDLQSGLVSGMPPRPFAQFDLTLPPLLEEDTRKTELEEELPQDASDELLLERVWRRLLRFLFLGDFHFFPFFL